MAWYSMAFLHAVCVYESTQIKELLELGGDYAGDIFGLCIWR